MRLAGGKTATGAGTAVLPCGGRLSFVGLAGVGAFLIDEADRAVSKLL